MLNKILVAVVAAMLCFPVFAFAKRSWTGPIKGYESITIPLYFEKGDCIRMDVKPLCKSDLDLYVYSADGCLITKDTDSCTSACVAFKVPDCGDYNIVIKNCGSMNTSFCLTIQ